MLIYILRWFACIKLFRPHHPLVSLLCPDKVLLHAVLRPGLSPPSPWVTKVASAVYCLFIKDIRFLLHLNFPWLGFLGDPDNLIQVNHSTSWSPLHSSVWLCGNFSNLIFSRLHTFYLSKTATSFLS